jgi:hypothetical protein
MSEKNTRAEDIDAIRVYERDAIGRLHYKCFSKSLLRVIGEKDFNEIIVAWRNEIKRTIRR